MTIQALEIMKTAFSACVTWTNQLFSAVDGSGVVLAGFCVMLVVNVLFIPMRGSAIWRGMSSLSDFSAQVTHKVSYKPKYSQYSKKPDYSKMGQFEKGNVKARLARRERNLSR